MFAGYLFPPGHRAEPPGRSLPYEHRSGAGGPSGLCRQDHGLEGGHPHLRRRQREGHPRVSEDGRPGPRGGRERAPDRQAAVLPHGGRRHPPPDHEIRELIRKLSEEHTIILSSHILSEVSAVCDYIMIINHGKLVASDTTENLMNHSLGSNTLELTVKGEKQDVEKMLRDVEEIQKLEWKPGENEKTVSMVITTEEKTDIREKLFYMMAEAKMPILNMQFTKVSLEDIFLELTQNETASVPDEQNTRPESAPEDETGTDTEKENETEQEAHDESNL